MGSLGMGSFDKTGIGMGGCNHHGSYPLVEPSPAQRRLGMDKNDHFLSLKKVVSLGMKRICSKYDPRAQGLRNYGHW